MHLVQKLFRQSNCWFQTNSDIDKIINELMTTDHDCLIGPQDYLLDQIYHHIDKIMHVNTLRPEIKGCHFADEIFNCTSQNENIEILIQIYIKKIDKIYH